MMRVAGADTFLLELNKAADTHANWLMDNGDSNPGAQWKRRDYCEKLKSEKHGKWWRKVGLLNNYNP